MRALAISAVLTGAGLVAFAAGGAAGTAANADVIVGNTHAAKYWFPQSAQDCAEGSAAVIIGVLTSHEPTEAAITAYAQSQGWYTPTGGTNAADIPNLYWWGGTVPSTAQATTLAGLEYALGHGSMVVALVNGETIWADLGFTTEVPGPTADHALVVDEINETKGTVTLTDTGNTKSGRLETVPLSVFGTAWATSGDAVVEVVA